MKNTTKTVITVLAFVIVGVLIWSNYSMNMAKKKEFAELGPKVAGYAETTGDRVAAAVITLPEGDTLVGLKDNYGTYRSDYSAQGKVQVIPSLLKTNFTGGVYGVRDPRLDAIVPMYVDGDSEKGSTYVVLFNDRGDVALEKSYARLGGRDISVDSITMLTPDTSVAGEEYKVDITYKSAGGTQKEVIIPVIDGHFDPTRTETK
jgi:hypothetical protein